MKNNLTKIFSTWILLFFVSNDLEAQVPENSAYSTDTPQFYLNDSTNDALSTPRMIMCFMGSLRPDLMVTGPDPVTYLALVDESECDSSSQVSSGPQNESASAAASATAQGAAVSYMEVIVTVSRASNNDPMIVKAWVPNGNPDGNGDQLIYTITEATAGASDDAPFGEFTMRYTGTITDSGTDIFYGYLTASENSLQWRDLYSDPDMGDLESRAVINFGEGATGNGAVSYVSFEAGTVNVDAYAYNEATFCRKNLSVNGQASGAEEVCFFTDEALGKKEVFSYKLYDSSTGAQYNLTNPGFGIKFTNDSDEVVYGFADFHGIHFQSDIANAVTNGQSFTRDDTGATVTAELLGGKLVRRDVSLVTLNSLDGLRFNTFFNSSNTTGISEPTTYKLYWDTASASFIVTHKNTCGDNGCKDLPLESNITFTGADYAADESLWGIGAWVPGLGSINIPPNAMTSPTESEVAYEIETAVAPSDYPTTLYCVQNCPRYTEIQALLTAAASDPTSIANNGPYTQYEAFGATTPITYTLNTETNVYGAGDGDAAYGSISSALKSAIDGTQWGSGAYSGPLVTTLSDLACEDENYPYCLDPIYDGSVTTYYQWSTGHQRWHTYRGLKDADGERISFSAPVALYFTAPDDSSTYQEFAGKEIKLEFGGGTNLWGIPGRCLNTSTGVFVEDCDNGAGGYFPWIDMFKLPKNETTGRLYTGKGQTGDYYLVSPFEGAVFLGGDEDSKGTLTLGSVDDLPSDDYVNVGPNGTEANYIGASPAKPDTVSIIQGVKQ